MTATIGRNRTKEDPMHDRRSSRAEETMSAFRIHRYGVRTERQDGGRVTLAAPGKPGLGVGLPSDFGNGVPGVWSPEELLIASLATCLELTMIAVAEHRDVPLHGVRVDATGHVVRKSNLYRLTLLELDVHAETDIGRRGDIEHIAQMAHEGCLVGNALDVPVRLDLAIHEAAIATAPA
jgi:organic hydroperoxide reductase OsmC/OhrA